MAEFRISVHLPPLMLASAVTASNFPSLARAVQMVAERAHAMWTAYAAGAPDVNGVALPGGPLKNPIGEYQNSIKLRQIGPFEAEVYSNLPLAKDIEEGAPARDLKKMLDTSFKVRISKKGKRYLIIPFRHNSPNSVMGNNMPKAVQKWWKTAEPSFINNGKIEYKRRSGTGAYDIKTRLPIMVPAWRYRWGDRLGKDHLEALGITGAAAKRLAGMVNFRNPGGDGRKKGSDSQFITFRTMMEGSPGWIVKAKPGKYPARTTAEAMRPFAEKVFAAAMEEDIKRLLLAP
jgi:hypothetical protein